MWWQPTCNAYISGFQAIKTTNDLADALKLGRVSASVERNPYSVLLDTEEVVEAVIILFQVLARLRMEWCSEALTKSANAYPDRIAISSAQDEGSGSTYEDPDRSPYQH
jgi:hypothetical protein